MSNIFEVFRYPEDGKARYEVLIQRHNDQEFDILRARAIHGHWSGLMTDQIDVKDTHQAPGRVYFCCVGRQSNDSAKNPSQ